MTSAVVVHLLHPHSKMHEMIMYSFHLMKELGTVFEHKNQNLFNIMSSRCMIDNDFFSKFKSVDSDTKDMVFGYIRKCQHLLPNNNSYYNIPSLVEHICIIYCWIPEYFSDHGHVITLNDNKNIAKNKHNDGQTVYGNCDIVDNTMLYQWTFKIIGSEYIYIGIDSSNKNYINTDFSEPYINSYDFYAYNSVGKIYSRNNVGREWKNGFKRGDIVKMEVDAMNKTLSFYINDEYQGIAVQNIDFENKKYNMAIYLYDNRNEIELMDFQQISHKYYK